MKEAKEHGFPSEQHLNEWQMEGLEQMAEAEVGAEVVEELLCDTRV
jgi:hypothetical protein